MLQAKPGRMVSNSSNKIHHTWDRLFAEPCSYGNLPETLPVLELPVVLGIAVLHGRRGRGHGDGRHDEELQHGFPSLATSSHGIRIVRKGFGRRLTWRGAKLPLFIDFGEGNW